MTRLPPENPGDRILRVAHAGEHGAVNIYRGQQLGARLSAAALLPRLAEFEAHEQAHRAIFAAELARRGRRRCRSYALCGLGGWVFGFVTGLLGENAIAATTVAVERVVLRHLAEHRRVLAPIDRQAHDALGRILADEQTHHDAFDAVPRGLVARAVDRLASASTEAVIRLGMRL